MDPLKVALASDWFYPKIGGIETHIHELAVNLMKLGLEPHVITHDYRFYGRYDDSSLPYPVHRVTGSVYIKSHHISVGPGSASKVNELFKRYKYDLTHVHSIYSPFALVVANVSRGIRSVPVVATNHSLFDWHSRTALSLLPLLRYSLKRVDMIIAVSSIVAKDTRRLLGRSLGLRIPVCVIPNAVDTSYWRPPEPEDEARAKRLLGVDGSDFVLLTVGRLVPRKRIHAVLKIAAKASRYAGKRIRLIVVGDGPLRSVLEKFASIYTSKTGGLLRVRIEGFVERRRLREYYWAADAVIVPGLMEAMPFTALEAMACARPVIGFVGTGLEDVISNGKNGFLVSSDEHAAKALAELALDPDLYARVSEAATAEIAGRFEWSIVARKIVEVYRWAVDMAYEDKLYLLYKLWLRVSRILGRQGGAS